MVNKALAEATRSALQSRPQNEIQSIVEDAYIFGFPMVLWGLTQKITTNTAQVDHTGHAPFNQFSHFQSFPDAKFKIIVRPNLDTLYSSAALDLRKEPIILSLPEMGNRYYLMQIMDAWTEDFSSIGTRTTGNHAGHYAFTGPEWSGTLPESITEIKAPTNIIGVLGRTQTNGKQDYETVHEFQKHYQLTPLSQWKKPIGKTTPAPVDKQLDMKTPPLEQVEKMNALTFFKHLAQLMKVNPPHPEDKAMIERLREIGLVPGEDFVFDSFNPEIRKIFDQGIRAAHDKILLQQRKMGELINGWNVNIESIGRYGTQYLERATIALFGLGANLPEDAVYPNALIDSHNQPLHGAQKYVIHFDQNDLPPVRAFWSITLYDEQGYLMDNPLNRYALGDRDPLKYNADGSLDIYVQAEPPEKAKQDNWLLTPDKGGFALTMRLYWPEKAVLNRTWKPPRIQPV